YLDAKGLPLPSFDANAPVELVIARGDEDVQKIRIELLDLTKELRDLIAGPTDLVRYLTWDGNHNISFLAIYHFKIASAFAADSTITYSEFSTRTSLDERNPRRICRRAMTNRIFHEPIKGTIAHTAASRLIAEDIQIQSWIGVHLKDLGKPALCTVDAVDKWPGSKDPLHTMLGSDPERLKRFGISTKSFSEGVRYEVDFLAEHYPWGRIREGTVVDVTSDPIFGLTCIGLTHQSLKFINQDLARVITGAEAGIPEELRSRVSFMPYDFFTPQPVRGADIYLFRWISHGRSDEYGVQTLRSQIPALKEGARILINEWCLPEPGGVSRWDEGIMRTMDLLMLTVVNSNERGPKFYFSGYEPAEGLPYVDD
ncbi:S-adenosyl-L-methionine-dependent methyltransferase, partial [Cenococcum geophilum 1.58]|uniref:S-adenosyl-L-methionine-dependent methyltransferase n=1 Tax=Cenococcum geophilum 1.58 TaxID=794803 RepID=UPI00358E62D6